MQGGTFATIPAFPLRWDRETRLLEPTTCCPGAPSVRIEAGTMSKSVEKKIQVKLELSKKYERLAGLAGSKPKQNTFLWHARHFRAQAEVMQKRLNHEAQAD